MANPDLQALRDRLGVDIPDDILIKSLTHRSYAFEHDTQPNERLEFLGDAVLGIVVTDALFTRHPESAEGELAKMRSAVVSAQALSELARSIGLGEFIRLGRGEETTGGREKRSILADALEAVFGAVYVSLGMAVATEMILRLTEPQLRATASLGAGLDWKTSLQELTAQLGLGAPEYVIKEAGPEHQKVFTAFVKLKDGYYGRGSGSSKKAAEQEAARLTYVELSDPAEAGSGKQ